jgi:fructuronate reductase
VVTGPFHEWVLSGAMPGGRPRWEDAGTTFADDVTPYEHRKVWLLNGAHSLLAYAGSVRGHATVAEAVRDETCRSWLGQWWTVASGHLARPAEDLARYRAALLDRFANVRMRDRLDRIAADGSQKLSIRILPVLRAERAAGRMPDGATRVLAAWVCHLRGLGVGDRRTGRRDGPARRRSAAHGGATAPDEPGPGPGLRRGRGGQRRRPQPATHRPGRPMTRVRRG